MDHHIAGLREVIPICLREIAPHVTPAVHAMLLNQLGQPLAAYLKVSDVTATDKFPALFQFELPQDVALAIIQSVDSLTGDHAKWRHLTRKFFRYVFDIHIGLVAFADDELAMGTVLRSRPSTPSSGPNLSFAPYDRQEFSTLAATAWNLCHEQSLRDSAHRLHRFVLGEDISPGVRLRLMALVERLAERGFQVAAIARDGICRESPLVRQLEEKSKIAIRWISLSDPRPNIGGPDDVRGKAEKLGRPIISHLKSALLVDHAEQVVVSGGMVRWLFDWPPARIQAELGTDYEVCAFPTTDQNESIRNLNTIRRAIARDSQKKHIFITLFPGCPWFPLAGPPSATAGLFPIGDSRYSARVFVYQMARWDSVLEYLAVDPEGIGDVGFRFCVFTYMDPNLWSTTIEAIRAAGCESERARILAQHSRQMLEAQRERDFDSGRRYVGTLDQMINDVEEAVRVAQAPEGSSI
jgi:hypothetical protein